MTPEEKKILDGIANAMIKDMRDMDNPDTPRWRETACKTNLKLEILKLKRIAK